MYVTYTYICMYIYGHPLWYDGFWSVPLVMIIMMLIVTRIMMTETVMKKMVMMIMMDPGSMDPAAWTLDPGSWIQYLRDFCCYMLEVNEAGIVP